MANNTNILDSVIASIAAGDYEVAANDLNYLVGGEVRILAATAQRLLRSEHPDRAASFVDCCYGH